MSESTTITAEYTEERRERLDRITGSVIKAGMRVHSVLGPGLLESAYQACLAFELRKHGLEVATEVALPVVYEGVKLDVGVSNGLAGRKAGCGRDQGCGVVTSHPHCTAAFT